MNGVTFAAYGSGPFGSWVSTSGLDDRYGSYANPNTADANYNYVLQTAIYSYGEPISLTWGGMTAGDTYQLEFWVNDGRNSMTAERSETLTGGANTSAALAYGTGPNGTGPGQYILGTFVADNTGYGDAYVDSIWWRRHRCVCSGQPFAASRHYVGPGAIDCRLLGCWRWHVVRSAFAGKNVSA